jgi:hypothetical protein
MPKERRSPRNSDEASQAGSESDVRTPKAFASRKGSQLPIMMTPPFVMPRPGQAGAISFDGLRVSEVPAEYEEESSEAGWSSAKQVSKFKTYCTPDVRADVEFLSTVDGDNWIAFKNELFRHYEHLDSSRWTMAHLRDTAKLAANDLPAFLRRFQEISADLVAQKRLSGEERVRMFLEQLPRQVLNLLLGHFYPRIHYSQPNDDFEFAFKYAQSRSVGHELAARLLAESEPRPHIWTNIQRVQQPIVSVNGSNVSIAQALAPSEQAIVPAVAAKEHVDSRTAVIRQFEGAGVTQEQFSMLLEKFEKLSNGVEILTRQSRRPSFSAGSPSQMPAANPLKRSRCRGPVDRQWQDSGYSSSLESNTLTTVP